MRSDPFITRSELEQLDNPIVLDVRWYLDGRDGFASYLRGHRKNAIFVDLDTVATRPAQPTAGRHPLPSPAEFAQALASLGISPSDHVVVMDDARGSIGARIWWMLDALGIKSSVLQGGVQSLDEHELCTQPCSRHAVAPWAPPRETWPDQRLVATDTLEQEHPNYLLLDARASSRYLGEEEPIDRAPGHIPGARSLPWTDLFDVLDAGQATTRPDIRSLIEDDRELVAYCGSGVTACALILAFRSLGRDVKLYPPSYSGWSSDPKHPICIEPC